MLRLERIGEKEKLCVEDAVGYPTIAPEDMPKRPALLARQSQVVVKSMDCGRGVAVSDW